MKLFSTILLFCFFQSSFSQNKKNEPLTNKIFIGKPGTDSLTKSIFLKQKFIQINADSLTIHSFDVYFSSCPLGVQHEDTVTLLQQIKGNSLTSDFFNVFNKRQLPVCIYFDIILINKRNQVSTLKGTYSIKVY